MMRSDGGRAPARGWIACAAMLGLLAWAPACWGLSSKMFIQSVFSNANGTIQFIDVVDAGLGDCDAGEDLWVGVRLVASGAQPARTHTFTTNLPTCKTSRRHVLIATQGFAALGLVTPDFVIPDGFVQTPNGDLDLAGADGIIYSGLPLDGEHAIDALGQIIPAVATNLAGQSASVKVAATPMPLTTTVIEYYHAGFDHYFITASPDEITKLDGGVFAGWQRTRLSFNAYVAESASAAPVCRFFSTAFDPKSSHFYTAIATECSSVQSDRSWQFEGIVLYLALPSPDGACPAGTQPVYRLYNNGAGGAPNHRYVTRNSDRLTMITQGWIPEGSGVGVAMCAPNSP